MVAEAGRLRETARSPSGTHARPSNAPRAERQTAPTSGPPGARPAAPITVAHEERLLLKAKLPGPQRAWHNASNASVGFYARPERTARSAPGIPPAEVV